MSNTNAKRTPKGGAPAPRITRRRWIGIALGGASIALVGARWWGTRKPAVFSGEQTPITVYSSPSCGCCHAWIDHMKDNGFDVTVQSLSDVTPMKRKLHVPNPLWSCHTGMVAGYVVEGHVPAEVVRKLIAERPSVIGVAVPGMPAGSPGMEGLTRDRYDVVAFSAAGEQSVYASF